MSSERPIGIAELASDPQGALRRLRAQGSVAPTETGMMVVGYEALRTMLVDERLRPSFFDFLEMFGISSGPFYEWMKISPLSMDGDEHRVWRQVMARTFTPRNVEQLRPFLKAQSNRLSDELAARGHAEFMADFARQLPSLGLCELIGVPAEDREQFTRWADTIGLGFNPLLMAARISEIDAALVALLEYAEKLVQERRKAPRDDLVTRIAQAVDQERGLPESLVRGSVAGLVFAGHETTKNQLGWMITILSESPAEWDRVGREPARATALIEELLRFRSTATAVGRKAQTDLELDGVPIRAGTLIMGSLWGANTDPRAFAEPDRLSVEENDKNPQMAFGHGPHHCLGAALARAELQEALIALSARITCPRIEAGATFLPPLGINGPLSLPITYSTRSAVTR